LAQGMPGPEGKDFQPQRFNMFGHHGNRENHRLKYAILGREMLVPRRERFLPWKN